MSSSSLDTGMTVDHELIRAAERVAAECSRGDEHTVAAAARARDGRIVTAMNVHHFTGGPCAELAVIGAAAAQGVHRLDMVVAVGDGGRGVMSPCGRCRQVLLDYFPSILVIIDTGGVLRAVPVAELLPAAYLWSDPSGLIRGTSVDRHLVTERLTSAVTGLPDPASGVTDVVALPSPRPCQPLDSKGDLQGGG